MSKIAQYLNEHIIGEVTTSVKDRLKVSTDDSLLSSAPEIVVKPQTVNDIRKVVRFSSQLAEKGFGVPVTVRGNGSSDNGSSLGDGVVIDMSAHMNRLPEFDARQNLIRVQAGERTSSINNALKLQGRSLSNESLFDQDGTIGGMISNGQEGPVRRDYTSLHEMVNTLEVVLWNGDVIQTSRISKKELNRKKGQQNYEGRLYREIDNLISDNQELIDSLDKEAPNFDGYSMIRYVKQPNGSFDLSPLLIGSNGTLGIISEMILKVDFYNPDQSSVIIGFDDSAHFRDALNEIEEEYDASCIVGVDDLALAKATAVGFKSQFLAEDKKLSDFKGLIYIEIDDQSDRSRLRKIKKLKKAMSKKYSSTLFYETKEEKDKDDALSFISLLAVLEQPAKSGSIVSDLFKGVYIKPERYEEFNLALREMMKKTGVVMPSVLMPNGICDFYPEFANQTSRNRQEMFIIYAKFAEIVAKHGGSIAGAASEGYIKAPFVEKLRSPELRKLYQDIKEVFDPVKVLNPRINSDVSVKDILIKFKK